MVIVWRLRGNIIRTALCWIVWHNVHSLQHTYVSSSYRSNRLGLSHWDPYAVRRDGCLELYYCNMVEWLWWDPSLISTTNWFPSVLWHCWFGHLACKNRPRMTYNVSSGTLNPTHSLTHSISEGLPGETFEDRYRGFFCANCSSCLYCSCTQSCHVYVSSFYRWAWTCWLLCGFCTCLS